MSYEIVDAHGCAGPVSRACLVEVILLAGPAWAQAAIPR
jgi:hypothetical protein